MGAFFTAILIIGGIIWGGVSLFSEDNNEKSDSSYHYTPQSNYSGYSSNNYSNYNNDEEDYIPESENPYDDGSGHSAGYEWAEENDVDSCGGNSNSFIEGCEEYLQQQEDYENGESDDY